jgi:nucleotide-binding universal stress UspA family protein
MMTLGLLLWESMGRGRKFKRPYGASTRRLTLMPVCGWSTSSTAAADLTPGVVKAQFLVAEAALQDARAAVEATGKPVKIEMDTVEGDPATTLMEASRWARLVFVGFPETAYHGGHGGSIAAKLATSAHCSVAIVPPARVSAHRTASSIVVLLGSSTDEYDVLQETMEEAQRRRLSLRAVRPDRRRPTDLDDSRPDVAGNLVDAEIEERLVDWTGRYPGIDAQLVRAKQLLSYVAEHRESIHTVVVGGEHRDEIARLVELIRSKSLHDTNFGLLVVRCQPSDYDEARRFSRR